MKFKILILLVLGALATSTAAWAATETQKSSTAKAEGCCGFCEPDIPCCGFCD